jgi:hypothetical protein
LRSGGTIAANVPFDFIAWNKAVPAGDCTVERVETGSTLVIRNVDAGIGTFAMSTQDRIKPTGQYKLVFRKYGTRHFLRQVKLADGTVYNLPESKLEREMLAQNIVANQEVLLASLK